MVANPARTACDLRGTGGRFRHGRTVARRSGGVRCSPRSNGRHGLPAFDGGGARLPESLTGGTRSNGRRVRSKAGRLADGGGAAHGRTADGLPTISEPSIVGNCRRFRWWRRSLPARRSDGGDFRTADRRGRLRGVPAARTLPANGRTVAESGGAFDGGGNPARTACDWRGTGGRFRRRGLSRRVTLVTPCDACHAPYIRPFIRPFIRSFIHSKYKPFRSRSVWRERWRERNGLYFSLILRNGCGVRWWRRIRRGTWSPLPMVATGGRSNR